MPDRRSLCGEGSSISWLRPPLAATLVFIFVLVLGVPACTPGTAYDDEPERAPEPTALATQEPETERANDVDAIEPPPVPYTVVVAGLEIGDEASTYGGPELGQGVYLGVDGMEFYRDADLFTVPEMASLLVPDGVRVVSLYAGGGAIFEHAILIEPNDVVSIPYVSPPDILPRVSRPFEAGEIAAAADALTSPGRIESRSIAYLVEKDFDRFSRMVAESDLTFRLLSFPDRFAEVFITLIECGRADYARSLLVELETRLENNDVRRESLDQPIRCS